jgi:hypothetical protein
MHLPESKQESGLSVAAGGRKERSGRRASRLEKALAKDYDRYAQRLAGFHVVASACLMLKRAAGIIQGA